VTTVLALEAAVLDRRIRHGAHPNVANAAIEIGPVGIGAVIDVSAIIAAVTLCFLARRRFPSFYFTIVGAALMATGLAVWFTFVTPMNATMATCPLIQFLQSSSPFATSGNIAMRLSH
jgi:hypothetical protein